MQLGILGLPKVGKTTLYNTLTAAHEATGKFHASKRTHLGTARVPDPRLEKLRDLFQPKRYTPATVDYVDIPGMHPGVTGDGKESLDLDKLRNVDALVHVVRAFDDPELPRADGSVDPAHDVETVDLELIIADHEIVERRLGRLAKSAKAGLKPDEARQQQLLAEVILPALDAEKPLREIDLGADDEKLVRGFQLLSAKPILLVLNVEEDRVADAEPADLGIAVTEHCGALVVSAPIEEEISRLEPEEQAEFLSDLALTEPSLNRVLRASYQLLGLISFFTVGDKDVRAWTIRRGTRARDAGRVIHSDIQRGFIRAEVIAWDELLRLGSLPAARDQGLLRLEGKDYIVHDGEVVHFRFNV